MEEYSFSKIQCFNNCKYAFYLQYIDPERFKRERKENAFSQYGSFVHKLLEEYANGHLASWELVDIYLAEFDRRITKQFPESFVDLYSVYYNDGYDYLNEFEGFEGEIIGVEQNFSLQLTPEKGEPFILHGFIDLILRDDDGEIIIIDHKSKSKFKNKKEQAEYAKQLYLYSLYIHKQYGKYPKLLRFNMFRKNNMVEFNFSQKELIATKQWLFDSVASIRSCKEYEPKSGSDNFYCVNLCDCFDDCAFCDCCAAV